MNVLPLCRLVQTSLGTLDDSILKSRPKLACVFFCKHSHFNVMGLEYNESLVIEIVLFGSLVSCLLSVVHEISQEFHVSGTAGKDLSMIAMA